MYKIQTAIEIYPQKGNNEGALDILTTAYIRLHEIKPTSFKQRKHTISTARKSRLHIP